MTVACPELFVTGDVVENVPPAPLSVNVTVTPDDSVSGPSSVTETISDFASLVLMGRLIVALNKIQSSCGSPVDCSLNLILIDPTEAVTLSDFATVGNV